MNDETPLILVAALALTLLAAVPNPPQWTIDQVESWRPLVTEVWDERNRLYDVNLVLAVIAQESKGNRHMVADDKWGSVGLMQVGPQPWMGVSREELSRPITNIRWGLWFLDHGFVHCESDVECALRVYNCGPRRPDCGGEYADLVLNYWLPVFEKEERWNSIQQILTKCCTGLSIREAQLLRSTGLSLGFLKSLPSGITSPQR